MDKRLHIWIVIALYVAALPYAIIIFNLLMNLLTLPVVKVIPIVIILGGGLYYSILCRKNNTGYYIKSFIIPTVLLLASVFIIESNPIKYLHIPEYAILTFLIYLALPRQNNQPIIIIAAIYACLFGFIDEVHHGIHPDRYFGWKDMYINGAGGTIGALFLNTRMRSSAKAFHSPSKAFLQFQVQSLVLLFSTLIAVYSLFQLFAAAQQTTLLSVYPFYLFLINLAIVGLSLALITRTYNQIYDNEGYEVYIFLPTLTFSVLHALIVFAYVSGIHFE